MKKPFMFSTRSLARSAVICVAWLMANLAQAAKWPLEPIFDSHPIGNSFGEFQSFGAGVYQHKGIDILATPRLDSSNDVDPNASWVAVTVDGTITWFPTDDGVPITSEVDVTSADGKRYTYAHLSYFDPSFVVIGTKQPPSTRLVTAPQRIGQVARQSCEFHHLHYQVGALIGDDRDSGTPSKTYYLSPLAEISPHVDAIPPTVGPLGLAVDQTSWTVFSPAASGLPGACVPVKGLVDVIAPVVDQDNAGVFVNGTATVGVSDLNWRQCSKTAPNCSWIPTYTFDRMPVGWGEGSSNPSSALQFSTSAPWPSNSDYCNATTNYMIPTNWVGSVPSTIGAWNTAGVSDGDYTVSVKAIDFALNATVRRVHVCVENSGNCTTDLTVRDGLDDTGAVPYTGSPFWHSPDITVNPGSTDENRNVNVGAANTVNITVWNTGSCVLTAGTNYTVCLGWSAPSGSVPFPLPSGQVVACKSETVPSGGWLPGNSRLTSFSWTPAANSLPLGHHCLVAWSSMPADPVESTAAVVLDANRAQRNITFQAAPVLGAQAYAAFWVNPLKEVAQRSLELRFKSSRSKPFLRGARIHVPPGIAVKDIVDAEVVGGYKGDPPQEPCNFGDESGCATPCIDWKHVVPRNCTLVLGGIGPYSRVRLDGITLNQPVQLVLEVTAAEELPLSGFIDAEIVEDGVLGADPVRTPIGGLTLRFERQPTGSLK